MICVKFIFILFLFFWSCFLNAEPSQKDLQVIQKQIEDELAEKLLSGALKEKSVIFVDVKKGVLTFKN